MELGETVKDALVREVKEEVGIRVRVEGLLDVVSSIHLDSRGRTRYHYVLICYVARPLRGKVRLNRESSDYGWFMPEDASRMNVTGGTARVVRRFARSAQSQS